LQLLGGVWILQTFPAVAVGLFTRWLHHRALIIGWVVGMVSGTLMVAHGGFSSVVMIGVDGWRVSVWAALAALAVNAAVAGALTPLLDRLGALRRPDMTDLAKAPSAAV
jgi:SSS family solute:Na+ symporter